MSLQKLLKLSLAALLVVFIGAGAYEAWEYAVAVDHAGLPLSYRGVLFSCENPECHGVARPIGVDSVKCGTCGRVFPTPE